MLQSSYTQLEPKFQFTGSQPTETNYTNPYVLLFRGNAKDLCVSLYWKERVCYNPPRRSATEI